eukprot:6203946-Pleurochrysis_carterae.AAC.3
MVSSRDAGTRVQTAPAVGGGASRTPLSSTPHAIESMCWREPHERFAWKEVWGPEDTQSPTVGSQLLQQHQEESSLHLRDILTNGSHAECVDIFRSIETTFLDGRCGRAP